MLSFSEVRDLNRKGNVIPVFERIPADLDTPVAAYLKLADKKRHAFLLESIEGGEKLARYSFVGFDPFLIITWDGEQVVLSQGRKQRRLDTEPQAFIRELFRFYRPVTIDGLPRFTGGAVGYFSYDTIRLFEKVPDENPDTIGLPALNLGLYKNLIAFDHLRQEIVVISNILHQPGEPGLRAKYRQAEAFLQQSIDRMHRPLKRPAAPRRAKGRIVAHYTEKEFAAMVRKAKRYIREGDIFQVVLSQRWHLDAPQPELDVYRRLRRINPSPYMFLIKAGDQAVIGASPEMLVRIENGQAETRPIAGTRPRGRNEAEDERLIRDLLQDPKELAEHTMLLDLGRNDLGRVSRPGTVVVKDKMIVEKYSHVTHLVSSVIGRLGRGSSPLDVHAACFPAGTVSGAPKIRAMEIIDELEKERRGVYAGSVAYIDFYGNLDSCIAIRTIVKNGRRYHIQAGAGIVADSQPKREFRETEAKAKALFEAVVGTAKP
ncbi:MAG: anthranilate synthase component I [bacterium]